MKIKLVFNRKKKKNTDQLTVDFYLYDAGEKKYIASGYLLAADQWDDNKKTVVKHPNADLLNIALQAKVSDVERAILFHEISAKPFSIADAEAILTGNRKKDDDDQVDFIAFSRKLLAEDQSIKPQTKRPQFRSLEELEDFKGAVNFDDINLELIKSFDNNLRKAGYAPNTIKRYHKDLRKFIRLAIAYDKMREEKNPYRRFKTGSWQPKTEFLQPSEIEAIKNCDLQQIDILELVRTMFLFSCYTGLRYSDLSRLKKSDFDHRTGGLVLFIKATQKTESPVFLRLYEMFNGEPEQIIQPFISNAGKGVIWKKNVSNSKFNDALKIIQNAAGISTRLTAHIARHTFGTLYARETNNILQVMAAMSIRKFETARIYVNLAAQLD